MNLSVLYHSSVCLVPASSKQFEAESPCSSGGSTLPVAFGKPELDLILVGRAAEHV